MASDLKVPETSISESKSPIIYLSKEAAFGYVKEELQKVDNVRKAGIKEIEEVICDAGKKADNNYASLGRFKKAQEQHQLAEEVLFIGVVAALSGFVTYSAHSLFQWLYKRLKKSFSQKKVNHGGTDSGE